MLPDVTIHSLECSLNLFKGSNILTTLVALPAFSTVHAISRRALPADLTQSSTLRPHISTDIDSWSDLLTTASPPPHVFFSGLGTTRSQAGSLAAQRKVDYDLNLAMAKAAKDAGVSTYVIMSVNGASSSSFVPYSRMKGEIDDAVQQLGFKHTIILRPGLLVGTRDNSRPAEAAFRGIAQCMGGISNGLKDFWAQDAEVVARAAVAASQQCTDGTRKEGVWIIDQADIVRLGRKEWKAN